MDTLPLNVYNASGGDALAWGKIQKTLERVCSFFMNDIPPIVLTEFKKLAEKILTELFSFIIRKRKKGVRIFANIKEFQNLVRRRGFRITL